MVQHTNFVIMDDRDGQVNRKESRSFGSSDLFLIYIKPTLPHSSHPNIIMEIYESVALLGS